MEYKLNKKYKNYMGVKHVDKNGGTVFVDKTILDDKGNVIDFVTVGVYQFRDKDEYSRIAGFVDRDIANFEARTVVTVEPVLSEDQIKELEGLE